MSMNPTLQSALGGTVVGAGGGVLAALVLNALRSDRRGKQDLRSSVPRTVVDVPKPVNEEEAERLKAQGIPVLRKTAVAYDGIGTAVHRVMTKVAGDSEEGRGFTGGVSSGFLNTALPIFGGLSGAYLTFKGVDSLLDKSRRSSAKKRFEKKREELQRLLAQAQPELRKAAAAERAGVPLGQFFVLTCGEIPRLTNDDYAFVKTANSGWLDRGRKTRNKLLETPGKLLGAAVGIPAALGAWYALRAANKTTRETNPNVEKEREARERFRRLPDVPRIRLVPVAS